MRFRKLVVILYGIVPLVSFAAARGDGTVVSAKAGQNAGAKHPSLQQKASFPKDIMKLDETNAQYFVARTLERTRALETATTLQRLLMQKQKDGEAAAKKLKDDYSILPAGNYVWEADDKTIYELTGEKTWRGEPKRLKFRKFKTDEEAKPVVQAMARRILLNQQVLVLSGLVAEQVDFASAADKALRAKFKLASEGNYTFDVPRRTIVQTGIKESVDRKESK